VKNLKAKFKKESNAAWLRNVSEIFSISKLVTMFKLTG